MLLDISLSILTLGNVDQHMMYAVQQHLDRYVEVVHHAIQHKAMFNRQAKKSRTSEVIFMKGQLVQVYNSALTKTLHTE
jgi:hemerythrin-like domain-containing protein